MSIRSYRHRTAEERENLEFEIGPRPFAANDGQGVGESPQHREPRVGAQRHAEPSLSDLHRSHPGGHPSPSAATTAENPGSLAVQYILTTSSIRTYPPMN